MYNFIKDFLINRSIQARVGTQYSNPRQLDMGIPQGSVIAPLLFNILIHDLPRAVTKHVTIVQYADDICMWMNTTIKRRTSHRQLIYIRRLYQLELDNISSYMFENGLSLSPEKTTMILFNSGDNPQNLPIFNLSTKPLNYSKMVKFLGIFLTNKLSWSSHFDYILTKARQSINFLKTLSKIPWAMDTQILLHLSSALIRSRLSYGQEVFFSAPKYLLQRIESLDCKALKLALGLPIHASNRSTYLTAGTLPLSDYREFCCAKFLIRYTSLPHSFITSEINIKSDKDFPKRAANITSQMSINTYVTPLISESDIDINRILINTPFPPTPQWELHKPYFDIDYISFSKDSNINLTASLAKSHMYEKYPDYLHIFTDGSMIENSAGASFSIPSLKINRSFFLGKYISIFTAELVGIIQALKFILESHPPNTKMILFVDSKSALQAIQSFNLKTRPDLIIEIRHLIHSIFSHNLTLCLSWIPAHVGILGNESADKSAKKGVSNSSDATTITVPLSTSELNHLLERTSWQRLRERSESRYKKINPHSFNHNIYITSPSLFTIRSVQCIFFRIHLNAIRTKFCKNVYCTCGAPFSLPHIFFSCFSISKYLPKAFVDQKYKEEDFNSIITNVGLLYSIAVSLFHSPIGKLL